MKNALLLSLAILIAGSAAVFAEESPKKGGESAEHFAESKKGMLQDLDRQISELQSFRDCVSAAADHAAAKKCHEEHERAMKAYRDAKKQERLQRIEEQQQKLEKEKQDLQQSDSKP